MEPLENRRVLAAEIFTVNSTADIDDGDPGSSVMTLREAIGLANSNSNLPDVDIIEFDIPETDEGYDLSNGVWTIRPGAETEGSALPDITEAVKINGTTQPFGLGFEEFSYPRILVNGFLAEPGSHGLNLVGGSDGSQITGLTINGFSGAGIHVLSSSNSINSNYIGTNFDGSSAVPNLNGIEISDFGSGGGDDNLIEGNLISGNGGTVVTVDGTDEPWDWVDDGLNTDFQFGTQDGTAPTIVDFAPINVVTGDMIKISYSRGTTNTGSFFFESVDADGYDNLDPMSGIFPYVANDASGSSGLFFPSKYMGPYPPNKHLHQLVGVFTDSDGVIVGDPFALGNDAPAVVVPIGAEQLQLGINDDIFEDNTGSLLIKVKQGTGFGFHEGHGVLMRGATTGNELTLNKIGTDVTGMSAIPNIRNGVSIYDGGSENHVGKAGGGELDETLNIISGNLEHGVDIAFGSSFNWVQNNYIGITADGSSALGNGVNGVLINQGASESPGSVGNIVGADGDGAIDDLEGNVISGNLNSGVEIGGAESHSNLVAGNLIGTDPLGTIPLPNASGVTIVSGAHDNQIGHVAFNAFNVISGNIFQGIGFFSGATDNVIEHNFIGTDISGEVAIPNDVGVRFNGFFDETSGNVIGGTDPAAKNVISGNFFGVILFGSQVFDNSIQGNFIGTNATGDADLGNGNDGIQIIAGAHDNLIGGIASAPGITPGNVISGNGTNGILIENSFPVEGEDLVNNVVQGNLIGVATIDNDGTIETIAIPNGSHGVAVQTSNYTLIGGSVAGARNIISGNGLDGVHIEDEAPASFTTVQGNYIGTDITGTTTIGNGSDGVEIVHSDNNTVADNLISGNGDNGVNINGGGSVDNLVTGNKIGTDVTGTADLGNGLNGVAIDSFASHNTIGGFTSTPGTAPGNLISGNDSAGIALGSTSGFNSVYGNLIGTDVSGLLDLGNSSSGIRMVETHNNQIGGDDEADTLLDGVVRARNVVSGNSDGIYITGEFSINNSVQGNYVGTTIGGDLPLGNNFQGIYIGFTGSVILPNCLGPVGNKSPEFNLIGGDTPGAGNVFSGNGTIGVFPNSFSCGGAGNTIQGNYVGTNAAGDDAIPNTIAGFFISSNNDTIVDNVVSGNGGDGIDIFGSWTTIASLANNKIGTNAAGDAPVPNTGHGVRIDHPSGIGDGGLGFYGIANNITIGPDNLISGNGLSGVYLAGGTSGNTIDTNTIGLGSNGSAVPNGANGVEIFDSNNNVVSSNVISGNSGEGVSIHGSSAFGNEILANMIGTDASGCTAIGNGFNGVFISGGAHNNTIGSSTLPSGSCGEVGVLAAAAALPGNVGNVISGNLNVGVAITGEGTDANEVIGNLIGTDVSGSSALGNENVGVFIAFGASSNTIGGNSMVTQGSGVNANGNVISGNSAGVRIVGAGTMQNVVQGNAIGTNRHGMSPIPNDFSGVEIFGGATDNEIGIGAASNGAAGNLISGNLFDGVVIVDSGTTGNEVSGNLIGTNTNGHLASALKLPNGGYGVSIFSGASGNKIGVYHEVGEPDDPAQANVISGNGFSGVGIQSLGTSGNVVAGNFIGTNDVSAAGLGNTHNGISIFGGATNNTIGGLLEIDRNIISGNGFGGPGSQPFEGIAITESGTNGNMVLGNFIGTKSDGTSALPNAGNGVRIDGGSANTIGGATEAARNIISGNTKSGVVLGNFHGATTSNIVQGNFIGTNRLGTGALPNGAHGIETEIVALNLVSLNQITNNVISGNTLNGVKLAEPATAVDAVFTVQLNTVSGNLIGLNAAGNAALPNAGAGIYVANQAMNNTISNNTISGNTQGGVKIRADNASLPNSRPSGNKIQGNKIGTNSAGTLAVANGVGGVLIADAVDSVIGGLTASPGTGLGNLISGNNGLGVQVDSTTIAVAVLQTIIQGNAIGTTAGGTALGNTLAGVRFSRGASNNTLGGTDPQAKNIIAFNGGAGVAVGLNATDPSVGNSIVRNSIFSNVGLGIDLGSNGVTANDVGDADSGPNHQQNKPVIGSVVSSAAGTTIFGTLNSIANSTFTLEFFDNPAGADEGQTYIGSISVTTDGSGNATFTTPQFSTGDLSGHSLTATATDATLLQSPNTSEFSAPVIVNENIAAKVRVTRSGYQNVGGTNVIQTVTFANISGSDINGDVYMVLDANASAKLVSVTAVAGFPLPTIGMTADGRKFIKLNLASSGGKLLAGASMRFVLRFSSNPSGYSFQSLAGGGPV